MEELIRYLIGRGVLKSKTIVGAFRSVDRANFVLPEDRENPYVDMPLSIGFGQTISQPTTVAILLELLEPKEGNTILDVGSGSGWTTTLLASIVGKHGEVRGVEIIPELVIFGRRNLAKYHFPWAEIKEAHYDLGLSKHPPFDRILVSAAGQSVPEKLLGQLKVGGTMVIPIGNAVWQIRKAAKEKLKIKKFEGFVFVPLIDLD